MRQFDWPAGVRLLGLLVTAFFFAAAVLQGLLAFDVLGAPPPPQEDFIERTIDFFEWQQSHWPVEFAATALFAMGFVALGGLGALLARLASRGDARRVLVPAAYVGAGGIGAASGLFWLGVKPIATSPQYCDCGLRAEEIMSRLMVLNVAESVQLWVVIGAIVLAALGAVMVAGIGRAAGMPGGWVWLTLVIAIVSLASTILAVAGAYPFDQLTLLLVAGVLVPIWALWLAIRADSLAPATGRATAEVDAGG